MSNSTPTRSNQQPAAMSLPQFLMTSRPKSQTILTQAPYVDGGTSTFQMPNVGCALTLLLRFNISVVIGGTVTGGTFKGWPGPAPFSIAKRIRFGSNNTLYYRDYSAWEAYKHNRYRHGFDSLSGANALFSPLTQQSLGISGSNLIRPGATVTAGTWNGSFALPIPLAYNRQGQLGMLVFQQNQIFFNLTIDWGQWASAAASAISNDLVTGVTGTNVTITPAVSLDLGYDYFDLLPNMGNLLTHFMSVNTFVPNQSPVQGTNIVQIPQTDIITMALLEIMNGGSPVNSNLMANVIMSHSGNVYDHQDNAAMKIVRSLYDHEGVPPMDGVFDWDLGLRMGTMQRRDTVDAFNDQNITNAQLQYTWPTTLALSNPTTSCLIEALRPLNPNVVNQ